MVIGIVLAGIAVLHIAPLPSSPPAEPATRRTGRPRSPAAARLRVPPVVGVVIAIELLYIVHWGVVVAFLPQRAEAAGANVGLFFVADGIAILLSRVPSGWIVDRIRPILPVPSD